MLNWFPFAGAYLLNIIWADRQVRGSPFKVNVVASSDASKVVCTGEGLKMGIMGKEIKSVIDTRRAGPGTTSGSTFFLWVLESVA